MDGSYQQYQKILGRGTAPRASSEAGRLHASSLVWAWNSKIWLFPGDTELGEEQGDTDNRRSLTSQRPVPQFPRKVPRASPRMSQGEAIR